MLDQKYTRRQVEMLKLLDNPEKWFEDNNSPFPVECHYIIRILMAAFPEDTRTELESQFQKLAEMGLINTDEKSICTFMKTEGIIASRTTEKGKRYIFEFESNESLTRRLDE